MSASDPWQPFNVVIGLPETRRPFTFASKHSNGPVWDVPAVPSRHVERQVSPAADSRRLLQRDRRTTETRPVADRQPSERPGAEAGQSRPAVPLRSFKQTSPGQNQRMWLATLGRLRLPHHRIEARTAWRIAPGMRHEPTSKPYPLPRCRPIIIPQFIGLSQSPSAPDDGAATPSSGAW